MEAHFKMFIGSIDTRASKRSAQISGECLGGRGNSFFTSVFAAKNRAQTYARGFIGGSQKKETMELSWISYKKNHTKIKFPHPCFDKVVKY